MFHSNKITRYIIVVILIAVCSVFVLLLWIYGGFNGTVSHVKILESEDRTALFNGEFKLSDASRDRLGEKPPFRKDEPHTLTVGVPDLESAIFVNDESVEKEAFEKMLSDKILDPSLRIVRIVYGKNPSVDCDRVANFVEMQARKRSLPVYHYWLSSDSLE